MWLSAQCILYIEIYCDFERNQPLCLKAAEMKQRILGAVILLVVGFITLKMDASPNAQATSFNAIPTVISLDEKTVGDGPMIVEDSMHEFMEYVFQPTYKRLKITMASAPENNSGWKAMKSDALILTESCNLLFPRTPDEDGADWKKHSVASRTNGAELYKAARAKDFAKATGAYKAMLESCNACHRQFENGKHILTP